MASISRCFIRATARRSVPGSALPVSRCCRSAISSRSRATISSSAPCRSFPNAQLVIVGAGPQDAALRELARRLGVAERVRFLGSMPQSALAEIYGAADILVLASSREGWANVLLEAMACGTPVVASNVGGSPEVVASPEIGEFDGERTPAARRPAPSRALLARASRPRARAGLCGAASAGTPRPQGQIELFESILHSRRQSQMIVREEPDFAQPARRVCRAFRRLRREELFRAGCVVRFAVAACRGIRAIAVRLYLDADQPRAGAVCRAAPSPHDRALNGFANFYSLEHGPLVASADGDGGVLTRLVAAIGGERPDWTSVGIDRARSAFRFAGPWSTGCEAARLHRADLFPFRHVVRGYARPRFSPLFRRAPGRLAEHLRRKAKAAQGSGIAYEFSEPGSDIEWPHRGLRDRLCQ